MSNIHQLLQVLQARPRVDQQIDVLHELNSALTMASGHPSQNRVGGVIQALVPLLSGTNNEVVLLAIRALITCIDITPRTATSLVESGAVAPMCRRLLKIQDMDVAEACLKCLHLLSKDNARAVLEAGGAKACLAFFDFFPMELQQNALDTVSRLVAPGVCGRRADIRRAREILPFLRECLQKQQAGGAVAGESSVGFHGGGIDAAERSGGDVRRSSTASGRGTLRGKDGAGDVSQMASLCLERMVVSFSTPIENTTEPRSVSRKLRRSRSNFSFRAPPRPCDRQRPPSLRVANENPAPGTSGTPSDPVGTPAVTEAAAAADGSEPVGERSKQKLAAERGDGQKEIDEEALTPGDVGDTPSPSFSSPSLPSSPGDGDGSENGPKGESRPPAESKGEGVPIDEGGGAADGEEGEPSAGAPAAAIPSSSVSKKGKGKARASNVGASSSAPPLPAASGGGARNEEWSSVISSADGRVALGDQPVDGGSMVERAKERELESLVETARVMAVLSLMEMSPKENRAACDEEGVSPAVDAVGFRAMEVDVDEGEAKGDAEKEVVKTDDVGGGGRRRASAGAENSYDNGEPWWKRVLTIKMSQEEYKAEASTAARAAAVCATAPVTPGVSKYVEVGCLLAVAAAATALATDVTVSEALVPLIAAVYGEPADCAASASATAAPAAGACAGAGIPAAAAPASPVKAAGTQSSCKAPVAAPREGEKKEQGRLAGGLKAWQVAFVLEIAEGGVLSAWSRTLEDSVKALIGGASGDFAPGWLLQSRLLSTIARVVSAAPVAVQALFDVGMPRLLRRILADYVCCDLVTVEGASGTGSTNSEGRWKPSPLADSRIGEERLLAALGLATAMLPPPSGKTEDSKASSSRRGKGPTAATLEGKPESMDVDESPDGCEEAGRRALERFVEDCVSGEKRKYSDGGDCTDDDEGLPPELEQAAVAAAAAAAGKGRVKRGGDIIGRGHFDARDADETGAQSKESSFEASSRDATSGGDGGVEETKEVAQGMGERSPAAATATADGTGGPSESVNRGAGGPDGDALNPTTEPRTAKTNSSISSPSLLPAIGGSELEEEHRQRMTGVEGPTANTVAPRHHAREEINGDGVSANGDPAETAQAQARARRAAEDASKAAAADAAAAASAARAAREAAAAAAAAASGAEWACLACTFINHGSGFGRVCEVCGTPNASAVAAVTAGGAGGFFGGGALEARLQALRFRGGRGVGSGGGGVSIWESDAMGAEDDEGDDDSGIPGFPSHWHRGVGADRDDGNPETVYSRNEAEVAEENHEDEDDKDSEMFIPDDKVFVRLRHVYGQDEGLFQEFSRELLAPLLRLVPSGLSSPKAVSLAAAALVSLRQNSVDCLLRKECADELAAALYRLLSKREGALRTGALAVAEAVLQPRSPDELGEACISKGKSAVTTGGEETKSSPPSSASATGGAAYYRELFARHGVLKLVEGCRDEHPSPAFDAEVLRAPLTSSSSSGSPQLLHPTLVNLCEIAARLYLSSPPDPRRLDCGDQNNDDRHGGGRLPRTTKDEGVAASPAGEQSTSKGKGKGKGKVVCPPGGEREETGGGSSCVSSGLSLRGVLRDGLGPNKFTAWDPPAKENGVVGSKGGDGSDVSLAFSDLTRALKRHLGGVTTFEAEESGVLRALLRALLNGAHGNDVSAGALAAGEESAASLSEEDTAPLRKDTHVAPSRGVHRKGDGGENSPSSFDNDLAPMETEPVDAGEFTEGCGVTSMATPSGSIVTPGAASIKRELDDPDEAPLFPVAALQSSPSGEADSTMVAATDGDVRGGSAASSSAVFSRRGAAVRTRLTGSDFFLEVGKALLTPYKDGRLPMESLISMTQGCLQALTDDVMVVNHGGDTEAAHYRSLVRPFTVLLSPGPSPPRASPPAPENNASSHSSEPRPGSTAGVKDEILSPLSGSAVGGDAGDAEEVSNATAPDNAAAGAAASTGGWTRGSSMDDDSGVSTAGVERDPNACAAVAETRTRGTTKQECDSAPQQQPSSSLGVSTSALAVRAGETGKGGRREAAMAERMEAQAGLLRSLSVGLHPVLLVEPLTTVGEVIKWYTVQLEKAFKLYKRRRRQERQRAAEEAQDLASPNRAVPLLTTSEGSPVRHEPPVTTRGKAAATAADTGSGSTPRKRTMPDRAAKRKSGMAQGGGSKTVRGGRKTRVSRRNSTSSISSSVSGHAGRGSVLMAAQELKGGSMEIELAISRATDAAAAAGDGDGAAASTTALSSVSQRAAKRRRASSPRSEAEAASGEGGEGGGEGVSSTPRSGRSRASSRSSSRSRVNKNTAAAGKTAEEEGSNTRLRQRRKVEGGSSSSGVVMAAGSSAAPSPAPGSSQGSISGLGKKKGSAAVGGGGVESGGGDSAGGVSKPEPTRLRPGREVFCCFRTSKGEDRSGMWYRGTVDVHHRDGTLDVRFDDGDLRENIPRSHVTITLPSVVQVHQEKRPWRNLWSPAQQQATPAATSTVYTSSGAGGPSAAAAEATATATSTVADGSTGGEGVDGDHAQERPGTVDTSSQSSVRPAAEESREKMHRAAAASSTEAAAAFSSGTSSTKDAEAPSIGPPPVSSSRRGAGGPSSRSVDTATAIELEFARLRRARSIQDARKAVGGFGEAAAASSSGTRSTKEAEVPSIGPPAVSSSRRGAGGPSSRNVDTAAAIEREFAMLRHARSMHDARNAIGGFGVGLGVGLGERGGQGGGTSALATSTTLRMTIPGMVDEDSPAGPGVRIQLMSTRRGLTPGPSSAPRSSSSTARQGPGASESRSSGTPGEGGSSRSIGGGVEEKEGASDGQRDVSPTRGQPGANSGGGVEGGVGPLGKGQQQSKERGRGGASSSPSMSASGSGLRLASASPSVALTRGETAADAPSAAAEATSTAAEGRPVTRQSSAASSAGGGGSSSSEPTAASTPGRRLSKRKRSTGGNAGGSGVAGDSGAADASAGAGAAVDGRVLRRASTRSRASTTKSPTEPPVYLDKSVTTDKYGGPPFAIRGCVSTKHPDDKDGPGGHPQSGTNSGSNSRSRSTTGRKTRASAAAAAAAEAAKVAGAEAEPISAKGRSSPSRGSGRGGESARRSRNSVRFPRLQWTLRYDWDAASATNVDVTGGEIPNGATMFEAVQLLMFKHSQETEGDVPRTSNWDLFKHRSMRVPLEQWGKSITLEFSPRRPKSSPISQVEGVSGAGAGARQSVARREEESASAAPTAPSSISPLPTAELPTTMETSTPGRKNRGSSNGVGKTRENEKENRSRPSKVRKGAGMEGSSNSSGGANASASGGVQVFELPPVLTPGATPLDARLASLRALLEGGGIGAGLRFGEHMCLLAALQAFCEEWGPLRKRLALKGRVDDDVPDPHPSVLHDLAKRCVVAGLQRKVSRQACNPLALCSGSLPSWCVRLPAEFPTLFSLETRLALYKKTSLGMARAVAHVQKKAKNVEDQPQGSSSGSSQSPNEMMAGVAGRIGGLMGHGGPDASATPLPELLRQLGRLGRLTVLLSRDSVLEMATFLFGLLVNGQKQPPHQRSIHPPTSSGPEAGSSGNRQRSGRASAPGRLRREGGVVGGAATRVRGFGGGGSGSSGRLGYGDFDVSNDDDDDDYVSGDDEEDYDGEEKVMPLEGNGEGGDGSGDVGEMELDEDALSDAEEQDPGHGHVLSRQAQQPQPPLPSEAGGGNAVRGEDRRVVTVEASVPPPHAGRQAENLADMESMLLVEFAGETGHGTGPTLEFYSLVCRELIRKGLGMWRGDDVSRSPPQGTTNSSTVSVGQKEGSETSPTLEGLDDSEVGESEGKGSATRGVDGGDGPGALSQQDDMAVEDDPFLQVGPEGLFPAPLDVRNRRLCASVEARFRLLGRVMGKALKDGRMLDLPLALPLCSLIVGLRRHDGTSSSAGGSPGEGNGGHGRSTAMGSGRLGGNAKPLTLVDVGLVDAALGRSLESVAKLAEEVQRAKAFGEMKHAGRHLSGPGDPETLPSPPPRSISELEACAGTLCLSWSLPGCPWYELRPGGADTDVTASYLGEWVDEVTRVFLVDSVVTQVEALVKGVSEVIDPSKLSLLTAGELQRLVGGEAAGGADGDLEWDYHRIMESLVCRHGYSVESAQVKWLAQVMASLDPAGRRQFLRFVTGTPRLPIGGFAALRPRLTVVKKDAGGKRGGSPDAHLPSCSTCQVYLKLPAYTSKNALETKLLHAITEGQDHFALD